MIDKPNLGLPVNSRLIICIPVDISSLPSIMVRHKDPRMGLSDINLVIHQSTHGLDELEVLWTPAPIKVETLGVGVEFLLGELPGNGKPRIHIGLGEEIPTIMHPDGAVLDSFEILNGLSLECCHALPYDS